MFELINRSEFSEHLVFLFFGKQSDCFQPEPFLGAIAKGSRFQSRFSVRSEDLMAMMRSGKSSIKSLGSTVSVAMVG